jgi:hypothetical protein
MELTEVQPNLFKITNAPIRGFDWKLLRDSGVGTYAYIAREVSDVGDEEIVIEEYSDPEHRRKWDNMTDVEVAEAAYASLPKIINWLAMEEPKTPTERKRDERARKKKLGLVRRDVWALEEDWPKIREIEKISRQKATGKD